MATTPRFEDPLLTSDDSGKAAIRLELIPRTSACTGCSKSGYWPISKILVLVLVLMCLQSTGSLLGAAVPVLTRSYNNARTGVNGAETVLTPDSLSKQGLVRMRLPLFGDPAIDDPRIEAQPLYVSGLKMEDGRIHDVIFVCSMANSIYAFDANTGRLLKPYPISLGPPVPAKKTNVINDIAFWHINSEWGILSTPVIDLDIGVMYVINDTVEEDGQQAYRLNAIDLVTGKPRHPARAVRAESGGGREEWHVIFSPPMQKQRAALLLVPLRQPIGSPVKKVIYMACGVAEENAPAQHGWLVAFDPETLETTAAWCPTPHGSAGGIWQAGQGPSADSNGDVYLITSNGGTGMQRVSWSYFLGDLLLYRHLDNKKIDPKSTDFSECFVKLHYTPAAPDVPADLKVAGWWCAFNDTDRKLIEDYDFQDQDLGSSGAVLPDGTNFVLGAGKDGVLYVFDRDRLGNAFQDYSYLMQNPPAFITYDPPPGKKSTGDLDFFAKDDKTHHLHGSPVVWNNPTGGPLLFVWGENEYLRAWNFNPKTGKVSLRAKGSEIVTSDSPHGGMPGAMLTLSANGLLPHTGIVWATTPIHHDSSQAVGSGILRAYDATELSTVNNSDGTPRMKLLWDSVHGSAPQNTTSDPFFPFDYDKFCPPIVTDGKVIVATYDGHVDVYTLRTPPTN